MTQSKHCPSSGSLCCQQPWPELLYVVSSQLTFYFSPRHQFLRKIHSEIALFHRTLLDSNIFLKAYLTNETIRHDQYLLRQEREKLVKMGSI